jgi:hypothetical protein
MGLAPRPCACSEVAIGTPNLSRCNLHRARKSRNSGAEYPIEWDPFDYAMATMVISGRRSIDSVLFRNRARWRLQWSSERGSDVLIRLKWLPDMLQSADNS